MWTDPTHPHEAQAPATQEGEENKPSMNKPNTSNGPTTPTPSTKAKGLRVTIEDGDLVVRIPVNRTPQPSASGKSLVVSSSRGNVTTDLEVNGEQVKIGLNAYIDN